MSHWAQLDENNIVIAVTVGDNNDPSGDEGYGWLVKNVGGIWIKTSYNNNIRKNYAGIGYKYDLEKDAFIAPKPQAIIKNDGQQIDWILDEDTCRWYLQIN